MFKSVNTLFDEKLKLFGNGFNMYFIIKIERTFLYTYIQIKKFVDVLIIDDIADLHIKRLS